MQSLSCVDMPSVQPVPERLAGAAGFLHSTFSPWDDLCNVSSELEFLFTKSIRPNVQDFPLMFV